MEGMAILDIGHRMAEGKQCQHLRGKVSAVVKRQIATGDGVRTGG
jgi:isocitrate lyase